MNKKSYAYFFLSALSIGSFVPANAFVFNNIQRLLVRNVINMGIVVAYPSSFYKKHSKCSDVFLGSGIGAIPVSATINAGIGYFPSIVNSIQGKLDSLFSIDKSSKSPTNRKRFKELFMYHLLMDATSSLRSLILYATNPAWYHECKYEDVVKFEQDDLNILGVDQGDDRDAIAKAYRAKALLCHPDKVKEKEEEFKALGESKERMDEILCEWESGISQKRFNYGKWCGVPFLGLLTYPIKERLCKKAAKKLADKWDESVEKRTSAKKEAAELPTFSSTSLESIVPVESITA